jgi:alkylation response protein AidB-like acyl-CoA dehydrogenase
MKNAHSLETLVQTVVAPAAMATDREASFPRAALDALAQAGWLGLLSSQDVGGQGGTLADASTVVSQIANACGSTAMVVTMHYCATAVIEKYGDPGLRRAIAAGRHISTLAFSESGSRSHFWAPVSTAIADNAAFILEGKKTMVTSAGQADSYVWSSGVVSGGAGSSLWLVDADAEELTIPKPFDGLGLRGNASAPVTASGLRLTEQDRLGADGEGFTIMMNTVLPIFSVLNAACSLGLMEASLKSASEHVSGARFEHLGGTLADLPTIRAYLARARIRLDCVKALLADTLEAIAESREDAMLRVLEIKAAAAEAALEVTDTAMRVCGGAAFRKDLPIERHNRDARAASVMAPTSDVLYDFIGKSLCGLPLF